MIDERNPRRSLEIEIKRSKEFRDAFCVRVKFLPDALWRGEDLYPDELEKIAHKYLHAQRKSCYTCIHCHVCSLRKTIWEDVLLSRFFNDNAPIQALFDTVALRCIEFKPTDEYDKFWEMRNEIN